MLSVVDDLIDGFLEVGDVLLRSGPEQRLAQLSDAVYQATSLSSSIAPLKEAEPRLEHIREMRLVDPYLA
jgi:hypothetical protein